MAVEQLKGIKRCLALLACLTLLGCSGSQAAAPVVNGWSQPAGARGQYTVQPGDTVYSIAWAFDMDFRDLARINHIAPPYAIHSGQRLCMSGQKPRPHSNPVAQGHSNPTAKAHSNPSNPVAREESVRFSSHGSKQAAKRRARRISKQPASPVRTRTVVRQPKVLRGPKESTARVKRRISKRHVARKGWLPPNQRVRRWLWPVHGHVIRRFRPRSGSKGINIAGRMGQPIHATAAGRIVYAGNGLPGYGRLIIIKHNDDYLSAYGHNHKLLIREGDVVRAGQVIATMGNSGAERVILHFEIRYRGRPVNPLWRLR